MLKKGNPTCSVQRGKRGVLGIAGRGVAEEGRRSSSGIQCGDLSLGGSGETLARQTSGCSGLAPAEQRLNALLRLGCVSGLHDEVRGALLRKQTRKAVSSGAACLPDQDGGSRHECVVRNISLR